MHDQDTTVPVLPTQDELDAIDKALNRLVDQQVGMSVRRAIGEVVAYDGELTVTHADIGRLLMWVDGMRAWIEDRAGSG